jgi:4-carboxymuconolactone decarboxylase
MHSPGLADRAQALGQYARYDSALPPDLSELAILVTARIWSSGFEWSHHAPIAATVGLPAEVIAAIGEARRPAFADPVQRAVFDASVEVHRDRRMSDATYEAALAALGLQGLIDLVGICGYYTLISMTINVFDVPDDAGPTLPAIDLRPEEMFRA